MASKMGQHKDLTGSKLRFNSSHRHTRLKCYCSSVECVSLNVPPHILFYFIWHCDIYFDAVPVMHGYTFVMVSQERTQMQNFHSKRVLIILKETNKARWPKFSKTSKLKHRSQFQY